MKTFGMLSPVDAVRGLMTLKEKQAALCASNSTDFSGLSAIILNCTLKRPDTESHTGKLLSVPAEIMRRNGVSVEEIRPATMTIALGVQPDMREHGWPEDAWPELWEKIAAAEILGIAASSAPMATFLARRSKKTRAVGAADECCRG